MIPLIILGIIGFLAIILILPSVRVIGPSEVGLVVKRFGAKLPGSSPIAFKNEVNKTKEKTFFGD